LPARREASHLLPEDGVHLPQKTLGDRQLLQSPDAVHHGAHVVPYFLHIINSVRLAEEQGLNLDGEEVGERGPGALDTRGEPPHA
jgi:hypothetical protein